MKSGKNIELLLSGPSPDFSEVRIFDQLPAEGFEPTITLFSKDIHWMETQAGSSATLHSDFEGEKFIILWSSWYVPLNAQLSIPEEYASWLFVV